MTTQELPLYKCHKTVRAVKIKEILQAPADQPRVNEGGDWLIVPEEAGFEPILVGQDDYVLRHRPEPGGYFVLYDTGYMSFSPAKAFEDGYTRL